MTFEIAGLNAMSLHRTMSAHHPQHAGQAEPHRGGGGGEKLRSRASSRFPHTAIPPNPCGTFGDFFAAENFG